MRPIPPDDIKNHLKEMCEKTAQTVLNSHDMDHDQTQYQRGRYRCYQELANWIETNYSN